MIEYKGVIWENYHGALIPKEKPDKKISLDGKDKKYLLKKSNAYILRYITKWDIDKETSFWYVIKNSFGDMEELSGNTRSKVRRAYKNCIVKKVDLEEIAENGYECYKEAMHSYNTTLKIISQEEFYKNTLNNTGYDYWAVYEQECNDLIAYSSNKVYEDCVDYTTIKFDPKYLKLYPSYALFFEMNKYYLNEKNFKFVNDGARSISHDTNIQDFLIQKFKFGKAYCKLNVEYRWDIGLIVKVLYPFRWMIKKLKYKKIFDKLNTLLIQEEIRRDCEK